MRRSRCPKPVGLKPLSPGKPELLSPVTRGCLRPGTGNETLYTGQGEELKPRSQIEPELEKGCNLNKRWITTVPSRAGRLQGNCAFLVGLRSHSENTRYQGMTHRVWELKWHHLETWEAPSRKTDRQLVPWQEITQEIQKKQLRNNSEDTGT